MGEAARGQPSKEERGTTKRDARPPKQHCTRQAGIASRRQARGGGRGTARAPAQTERHKRRKARAARQTRATSSEQGGRASTTTPPPKQQPPESPGQGERTSHRKWGKERRLQRQKVEKGTDMGARQDGEGTAKAGLKSTRLGRGRGGGEPPDTDEAEDSKQGGGERKRPRAGSAEEATASSVEAAKAAMGGAPPAALAERGGDGGESSE